MAWVVLFSSALIMMASSKDLMTCSLYARPSVAGFVTQTIIFASSDTPNVGDNVGDVSETKLTECQQKILNLIKESPTITGKQMSETLSVSQRTIERDLSTLQKKGVLKREGKDNNGVWILL